MTNQSQFHYWQSSTSGAYGKSRPGTQQRRKSTGDIQLLTGSSSKLTQQLTLYATQSKISTLSRPTTSISGNALDNGSKRASVTSSSRPKSKSLGALTLLSDKSLTLTQQHVLQSLHLAKKTIFDRHGQDGASPTGLPNVGGSASSPYLLQYFHQHHLKSAPSPSGQLLPQSASTSSSKKKRPEGGGDGLQHYLDQGIDDPLLSRTLSGKKPNKSGGVSKEVRFASSVMVSQGPSIPSALVKPVHLTEVLLKKHIEDTKKIETVGPMERIARWVASLPDQMGDPNKPLNETGRRPSLASFIERQLSRHESLSTSSNPYLSYESSGGTFGKTGSVSKDDQVNTVTKSVSFRSDMERLMSQQEQTQRRSQTAAILTEGDTMFAPLFPPEASSRTLVRPSTTNESKKPLADLDVPDMIDRKTNDTSLPRSKANLASSKQKSFSSTTGDRGKLLCCLKVEIRSGVYRMLPVHQKDDARSLANTFCKANNLAGSIDALKDHISQAMKSYT